MPQDSNVIASIRIDQSHMVINIFSNNIVLVHRLEAHCLAFYSSFIIKISSKIVFITLFTDMN